MGQKRNSREQEQQQNEQDVQSNDPRVKQDFQGFPHHPASPEDMDEEVNWKTDFSNESNTTATGTESVRDERPSRSDNQTGNEKDFLSQNDRGLNLHNNGEEE